MEETIAPEKLAEAFQTPTKAGKAEKVTGGEADKQPEKAKKPKKAKFPIVAKVVFVLGLFVLCGGIAFLVVKLMSKPVISDAEFLVTQKTWSLVDGTNCIPMATDDLDGDAESTNEDSETEESEKAEDDDAAQTNCLPSLVWEFTEVGKGTLTTNGHINDYEFIWALDEDRLKIETKWLYDLNNEYTYELDQEKGELTLTDGEETIVLKH